MKIKMKIFYSYIIFCFLITFFLGTSHYIYYNKIRFLDSSIRNLYILLAVLLIGVGTILFSYIFAKKNYKNYKFFSNKLISKLISKDEVYVDCFKIDELKIQELWDSYIEKYEKQNEELIQKNKEIYQIMENLKKELNETKANNEELIIKNDSKIKFIASISNELRNPISGIVGMSEILIGTNVNEKQKKYLMKLRESSDMLIAIVNDVLDITEIETII